VQKDRFRWSGEWFLAALKFALHMCQREGQKLCAVVSVNEGLQYGRDMLLIYMIEVNCLKRLRTVN
jgi:hypothetical protein